MCSGIVIPPLQVGALELPTGQYLRMPVPIVRAGCYRCYIFPHMWYGYPNLCVSRPLQMSAKT